MTQENKDIFDLRNLSDIPDEIKDELVCTKMDKTKKLILEFFETREALSIDEVMVALFRSGKPMKRTQVTAKLYNMRKGDLIRSGKAKGVYKK